MPNAQSHTGCYWAYEDFTHNTLFTAGSLLYVLKMAGFAHIEIIDKDALVGVKGGKKNNPQNLFETLQTKLCLLESHHK